MEQPWLIEDFEWTLSRISDVRPAKPLIRRIKKGLIVFADKLMIVIGLCKCVMKKVANFIVRYAILPESSPKISSKNEKRNSKEKYIIREEIPLN